MAILLVLIILIVVVGLIFIVLYNGLVALRNKVEAAWAQIDVQLTRRSDLIPNLVETVKGYAAHERETLEAVVNARARATQVTLPPDLLTNPEAFRQFQQNQQALSGALGRLLAVSENYPQLKSNENFMALQSQLEGTENRITWARSRRRSPICRCRR